MSTLVAERNRKILQDLVTQPGNDTCADCKSPAPRWASHNLGIFLCVNCASIHRKIGTHITKVKSITMDSWTKEQTESMKQIGNLKSNSKYNPNELRHPPPTNLMDGERDSELEKFIRAKYEYKRFMDKGPAVASRSGPPTSSVAPRSRSTPLDTPRAAPMPTRPPTVAPQVETRPNPPQIITTPSSTVQQTPQFAHTNKDGVWSDLISLQSSNTSSLPLQYQAQILPQQPYSAGAIGAVSSSPAGLFNPPLGMSPGPFQQQVFAPHSSFMPSFPNSSPGSFSPSPMSFQQQSHFPTHSPVLPQQPYMPPPIAQPLAQNAFPQTGFGGNFNTPLLSSSPQPMMTPAQGQFLTSSPQPQFQALQQQNMMPQQGGWMPQGSMPGQGWGTM